VWWIKRWCVRSFMTTSAIVPCCCCVDWEGLCVRCVSNSGACARLWRHVLASGDAALGERACAQSSEGLMNILIHCARWPAALVHCNYCWRASDPVILCCVVDREILHTCEIVRSAHVFFSRFFTFCGLRRPANRLTSSLIDCPCFAFAGPAATQQDVDGCCAAE
jgi:hypothetical protein